MSEGKLAHCQLDALKQTAPVALSHQKMQLEEVTTDNCDTTLAKLSGPVGAIAVMDRAMEQAQEGRSMLLDSASPQIVKNLENVKKHFSELKVKIKDCSFSDLRTPRTGKMVCCRMAQKALSTLQRKRAISSLFACSSRQASTQFGPP